MHYGAMTHTSVGALNCLGAMRPPPSLSSSTQPSARYRSDQTAIQDFQSDQRERMCQRTLSSDPDSSESP